MAGPRKDESDMFARQSVTQSVESIPPVAEVLTPPEELRRQRVRRIALGATLAVLLGVAGYTVWHFLRQHELETAGVAAGESGRIAAIEDALDTIGSDAPGLRARLIATAALAGARTLDEAQAAIDEVPEDEEEASERVKAQTYLALARGQADVAYELASRLIPFGTYAAETALAKSLAATAHGDFVSAVREAEAAVATHGRSTRYESQLAWARALTREFDEALAALERADAGAPNVLLARARVLTLDRREGVDPLAEQVLAHEEATPAEKAWARLLRAVVAARRGDRSGALRHLAEATAEPPPGDHYFRWMAAETHILAGDLDGARPLAEGPPSGDLGQSGRVRAAFALAGGEARDALGHLARVPATPAARLLVARAQQALDNPDEARAALEAAAAHPGYAAAAHAAWAELELAAERSDEAVRHARASLEAEPHHPAHVAIAVKVLLAAEENDEALSVAAAALEQWPEDVRVLSAKGDALLAKDDMGGALEVLRLAVAQLGDSPGAEHVDLFAKRGRAAHAEGENAEAREAYEAALALDDDHPSALPGLFRLDVEEANIDHATPLKQRIVDADLVDDDMRVLFARYDVARSAGTAATSSVMRSMRRRRLRGNAYLRFALAELYLQAEFYRPAIGMYDQAARLGHDRVQALIGRGMAHAFDGRTNLANEAIQEALDAARPEGSDPGADSPAAEDPRLLAVRARMELNLGRFPAARRYAERAIAADASLTEAHLVLAQCTIRARRDPTEHLRAAIAYPKPQTLAFALLATRVEGEERCTLAQRYLRATQRRSEHHDAMDAIREACE